MKVLFAASAGGHLDEITNLQKIADKHELLLLTEKTDCRITGIYQRVFLVPQVNRKEWKCALKLLVNFIVSYRLLCEQKPKVVVSIGALATIPVCILARFMGIKVIYIESFARTETPSRTGKLLYNVANHTVVQWQELLKYYPDAVYGGSIY